MTQKNFFIEHLLFPVSMVGFIVFGIYAVFTPVDKTFYNIIIFASLMLGCIVLEHFFPYSNMSVTKARTKADIIVTLINVTIVAKIGELVVANSVHWVAGKIWFTKPNLGPYWFQVILSVLIIDFTRYWIHRWQHRVPYLWRLHAIHHSIPKVYALNGLFAHPIDFFLRNIMPMFIPFLIGIDATPWFISTIVLTVAGSFPHVNIPLQYGFLEKIFCSNRLHRWHHSEKILESNTNFGVGLIIYDRLFGTLFDPPGREAPTKMGIEGVTVPVDDIKELVRLPATKYV